MYWERIRDYLLSIQVVVAVFIFPNLIDCIKYCRYIFAQSISPWKPNLSRTPSRHCLVTGESLTLWNIATAKKPSFLTEHKKTVRSKY